MAKPRPKFQILSVTQAAADHVRRILGASDPPARGVRVGVKNAGCAGMSYTLDAVTEPDPRDDVVEDKGVAVYIDPKAVLFLVGTVMDHRATKLSSGFVFENPNQISACGCGESVTLKAAAMPAGEAAHA